MPIRVPRVPASARLPLNFPFGGLGDFFAELGVDIRAIISGIACGLRAATPDHAPSRACSFATFSDADAPATLRGPRLRLYTACMLYCQLLSAWHADIVQGCRRNESRILSFMKENIMRITQHLAESPISAANSLPTPFWRLKTAWNSAAGRLGKRHPSLSFPTIICRRSGVFGARKRVFSLTAGNFARSDPAGGVGVTARRRGSCAAIPMRRRRGRAP